MSITAFINENRAELKECIRSVCSNCDLTYSDIKEWIENDEGLYNWARSEGVNI